MTAREVGEKITPHQFYRSTKTLAFYTKAIKQVVTISSIDEIVNMLAGACLVAVRL